MVNAAYLNNYEQDNDRYRDINDSYYNIQNIQYGAI